MEVVQALRDRALAKLEEARIAIKKATVRSPIKGTVDRRYVNVGEFLNRDQLLVDVANIERLYAVVHVPEKDRQFVYPGKEMRLFLDRLKTPNPGEPEEIVAKVRSISNIGDEQTRTYRAQAEFINPHGHVKPGMIGKAVMARQLVPLAMAINWDWIRPVSGEYVVYVEVAGAAMPRRVRLGITDGHRVEVTDGLIPGERVVTDPRLLTGGDLIRVCEVDGVEIKQESLPPPWELGRMTAGAVDRMKGRPADASGASLRGEGNEDQ